MSFNHRSKFYYKHFWNLQDFTRATIRNVFLLQLKLNITLFMYDNDDEYKVLLSLINFLFDNFLRMDGLL